MAPITRSRSSPRRLRAIRRASQKKNVRAAKQIRNSVGFDLQEAATKRCTRLKGLLHLPFLYGLQGGSPQHIVAIKKQLDKMDTRASKYEYRLIQDAIHTVI